MVAKIGDGIALLEIWLFCVAGVLFVGLQAPRHRQPQTRHQHPPQTRHHHRQVNAKAGARQTTTVTTTRDGIARQEIWLICVVDVPFVGPQARHQRPHHQPPRSQPQHPHHQPHHQPPRTRPQHPHHQLPRAGPQHPPQTQHHRRQVNAKAGAWTTTVVEKMLDDIARLEIWLTCVEAVLFVGQHHHPLLSPRTQGQ